MMHEVIEGKQSSVIVFDAISILCRIGKKTVVQEYNFFFYTIRLSTHNSGRCLIQ